MLQPRGTCTYLGIQKSVIRHVTPSRKLYCILRETVCSNVYTKVRYYDLSNPTGSKNSECRPSPVYVVLLLPRQDLSQLYDGNIPLIVDLYVICVAHMQRLFPALGRRHNSSHVQPHLMLYRWAKNNNSFPDPGP